MKPIIIPILLAVILFMAGFYFTINKVDPVRPNYDSVTNYYENKIKQKDSLNNIYKFKQDSLLNKIDSLEKRKTVIVINYDKKIKSINDASSSQLILRMDSTIAELSKGNSISK